MMSISNTTPSISAAPPRFLGSLSVNNIQTNASTESTKLVLQPQALFQVASNISLAPSSTSSNTTADQPNASSMSKVTFSTTAILSTRSIKHPALITISTPTHASVSQPLKTTHGKHHLPVRPLPVTSLSHVAPKPTITTTTTTSVCDPPGVLVAKSMSASSSIPTSSTAAKSKVTQHILMAPGLRTPNPSVKVHATYSPTHMYQVPNITTAPNNQPTINVAAIRSPASVLVRPIISTTSTPRTFVPLTVATTTPPTEMTRPTSVLYHPTSTISISIPARANNHAENIRTPLSSSQVGRSIYQVGIVPSAPISTLTTTKPQRPLVSLQPLTTTNTKPNYSIPILTNPPSTTLSGFAPSARFTTITTSAVAIAKVAPTQPTSRTPILPLPTTSVSSSNRAPDTRTTASTVVTCSAQISSRSSTFHPESQPPIVFWPQSSISYPPSSYMIGGESRTFTNLPANNTSIHESQSQNNQPTQYTTSSVQAPAFTQGQLLHTSNLTSIGKDRPTASHHPATISSNSSHLPNTSPKPAILRRPQRGDGKFHNSIDVSSERAPTKPGHEPVHSFIKPELTGQGHFGRPVVTSNGVSPANKVQGKDSSITAHPATVFNKQISHHPNTHQQNFSEIKVKTEVFQHGHFPMDTDPGLIHPAVHSMPYPFSKDPPLRHPTPGNKISIMQPLMNPSSSSLQASATFTPRSCLASTNLTHLREFKVETPPSGLKREHDKMNDPGVIIKQESMSPRKKPRKQTHVVAEDLPEQVGEDDVSTDDADENTNIPKTSTNVCVKLKQEDTVVASSLKLVSTFQRPSITMWSGHRLRAVYNHFHHHSEVKAKEKKVSLQDPAFNEQDLKGWKMMQFAAQFDQLVAMDSDALQRVEQVKEGLLQRVTALIHTNKPDLGASSPVHVRPNSTPATPCSTPGQPKGFTSFVMSLPTTLNNNLITLLSSPLSGNEVARLREEVLKFDDAAQANIQRCKVVQEQLQEAKHIMMKVLKQRLLACKVVKAGRETLKANKINNGSVSRHAKKKKS